jgi:hypothetical protein
MKKQLLGVAAAAVVFFSIQVCAQIRFEPGIMGGTTTMGLSDAPPSDTAVFPKYTMINSNNNRCLYSDSKGKPGFSIAAFCDIGLLKMICIRPAVVFSQRALSFSGRDTVAMIDPLGGPDYYDTLQKSGDFTARCLSFPVDVKIRYPGIPMVHPYLLAGVNTEIIMASSYHAAQQMTSPVSSPMSWDINAKPIEDKIYKKLNMGLDLGAGVEVPLGKIIPFVEFIYNLGLTNVNGQENEEATKSTGIQLKAGVKLKT